MNRLAGSRSGRHLAMVCAAFAMTTAAGSAGDVALGVVIAVALLIVGALVAAATRGRAVSLALIACLVCASAVGLLRGALADESPSVARIDGHFGTRAVAVIGTVREVTPDGAGPIIIDAGRLSDADNDVTIHGGLLVSGPNVPPVSPGDTVEVDAVGIRAPNTRPGPESEATLEREDVEAVAVSPLVSVTHVGGFSPSRAIAWMQSHLVAAVDHILPQPQAALTLGIAFGIRQSLAPEVRAPLQDAGLIHIVVVSGLKVVMVLGMAGACATALGWSPRRRLVLALPLVAGYVLLSGAGPAAIRSALMASGALVAGLGGRRTDPLPVLSLCGAAMLGIDPGLLHDPGFQLSFLGTAGIVVLARPLAARLPGPRLFVEPFAVTVAAQLATVPVMAGTFGVVAVAGPLANMLVLPLLPVLIVLGVAGAALAALAPFLGWALLQLAGLGATFTVLVARVLSALPGSFIPIGVWPFSWTLAELAGVTGGLVALALMRTKCSKLSAARLSGVEARRSARFKAAVAVALTALIAGGSMGYAASRPDGRLHLTVLNTGASTSVLIRTRDGSLALVDGGASAPVLLQALGRVLGPTDHRFGLVIVTGAEQAAVAGLGALPGHYDVGLVVVSQALNPGGAKVVAALQTAGASVLDAGGRSWRWGGATWQCLPFEAQRTDRAMYALLVADPGGGALILGDAGTADQDEIAAEYNPGLRADVLVSEPGGSLDTALLAAVRPRFIAVPAASGGSVAAAPLGYSVLRTSSGGDLQFTGSSTGLTDTT